jgi:cytosine/adenosine deaminase-related metal-dependent hydrolase
MEIHTAPWVLPISSAPIADGAIVVDNDTIVDVGYRLDIEKMYSSAHCKSHPKVLMPALVNCHAHLELSHLGAIRPPAVGEPFTGWIQRLIAERSASGDRHEEQRSARHRTIRDFINQGVGLVGDITNLYWQQHEGTLFQPLQILPLVELLAPTKKAAEGALSQAASYSRKTILSAHAPYSTTSTLLRYLYARSKELNHPFVIHTAESREELEFITHGSGAFRQFLEQRSSWDDSLNVNETGNFSGSVAYLANLGLLGENSTLVHCVHVSDAELDLIAAADASICLCPGSNNYLQVGRARAIAMVRKGINVAIGTDSTASNEVLDVWREMTIIADQHHGLAPADILIMATLAGAKALGYSGIFGELRAGAKAAVISVTSRKIQSCVSAHELVYELVTGGRPAVKWITPNRCA